MVHEAVEDEGALAAGILPAALEFSPEHHFGCGQKVKPLIAKPVYDRIRESLEAYTNNCSCQTIDVTG